MMHQVAKYFNGGTSLTAVETRKLNENLVDKIEECVSHVCRFHVFLTTRNPIVNLNLMKCFHFGISHGFTRSRRRSFNNNKILARRI